MPKYFFHVINGAFMPDPVGTECASADEVKALAIKAAGEMLTDQGLKVWETGQWHMFVCDEQNKTHLKIAFQAEDMTGALSEESS